MASLERGEDCHSATSAMSAALAQLLMPRLGIVSGSASGSGSRQQQPPPEGATAAAAASTAHPPRGRPLKGGVGEGGDDTSAAAADFLASAPSFALNLWMAACKCVLSAAEGTPGSSVVTSLGGNGLEVGVRLAGGGTEWVTALAAQPACISLGRPVGVWPRQPAGAAATGATAAAAAPLPLAQGAMGDSMVVEALGALGGNAAGHAPGMVAELAPLLAPLRTDDVPAAAVSAGSPVPPAGDDAVTAFERGMASLLLEEHPGFGAPQGRAVRVGLPAAAFLVAGAGAAAAEGDGHVGGRPPPLPRVHIAVVDAAGGLGMIGRGVFEVPSALLAEAASQLLAQATAAGTTGHDVPDDVSAVASTVEVCVA